MDMKVESEFDLDKVRVEFARWSRFLNEGYGLASFTLALACLGTPTPAVNAWVCFFFLLLMRLRADKLFPPSIVELRKVAKNDLSKKVFLQGIIVEFLGWRAMFVKYPLFIMGSIFLVFIMASQALRAHIPALAWYFGH